VQRKRLEQLAGEALRSGAPLSVPALSARTAPFLPVVDARVAAAQALTVVVNGPLRGTDGALIEPAIVIGQPVDGRSAVGCQVPMQHRCSP
jgi:hypothetical protein